jgi:hypothetical protein
MKKFCFVLCTALTIVGLAIFFGCTTGGDGNGVVVPGADATAACMPCPSSDTASCAQILGAQAQYASSGHFNGPRMLVPASVNSGHI